MATTTVKLTSYSSVVLTYTLENYSGNLYQMRVTNYKFTNSRSAGTTQKCWLDIEYEFSSGDLAYRYFVDGELGPVTVSLAKGTKSKSGAIPSGNMWVRMSRQHAAVSGTVKIWAQLTASDGDSWEKTASIAVTIPTKSSYGVSYDAAGGSGAPAAQVKWHGESLDLRTAHPSRIGYVFWKWNTSADGTGSDWLPGARYTSNAPLALHAIWNFTPRVTSLKAYRCDAHGNQDDAGTCAWVEAVWECDGTRSGNSGNVTAAVSDGETETPIAVGGQASGTGGTMTALVPNVDVDTQYMITVTVADSLGSVTRAAILTTSHFTMDVYVGGTGFGIGCAAPSSGLAFGYDLDARAGLACSGRAMLPTYLFDTRPTAADVPRLPSLVVVSTGELYLYTVDGITQL